MENMFLVYRLRQHRRLSSFIKDSFGYVVTSMFVRLLPLEDTLTARESLCAFMVSPSIKDVFQRLNSLIQMLETFQEMLSVDLVGILSLKPEFQRRNGQFTTMETTFDQCCILFLLLSKLDFIESHSSSRCVTSQGELLSNRLTSMVALTNGIDSIFVTPKECDYFQFKLQAKIYGQGDVEDIAKLDSYLLIKPFHKDRAKTLASLGIPLWLVMFTQPLNFSLDSLDKEG